MGKHTQHDGCTPFYIGPSGRAYYDLLDERGAPVQLLPQSPKSAAEVPAMTAKQHGRIGRIGRFYLIKHAGWYGLRRIDGTNDERWCANKKQAIEIARRITAREAEAERRAG